MCVLDKFSDTVLGVIKPKLWIVTTPNRDYNELFPDWPGPEARRHWDHKFEWSRNEFKKWIEEVVVKYPDYYVQIEGVGELDIISRRNTMSRMALHLRLLFFEAQLKEATKLRGVIQK